MLPVRGLLLLAAPLLAAQTATVEGTVFDRVTRTPIAGVTVGVTVARANEPPRIALTDSGGGFRIDSLPAGDCNVSFEKDGWISTIRSATAPTRILAALIRPA